ncbi:unnamed protein product, partial [Rotaria sp. Silwood2]
FSLNQPKFCPVVSWQTNGSIIANSTMIGTVPIGMFIDNNNTIYITDQHDKPLRIYNERDSKLKIINLTNFSPSNGIFITNHGEIYLSSQTEHSQIVKWSKDLKTHVTVANIEGICYGLFVDIANNLYCSVSDNHQVIKRSLWDMNSLSTIVAGNGSCGSTSNTLCRPSGIFVDTNFNLYVADTNNSRIQFFKQGKSDGETVVSKDTFKNILLNKPIDIKVDSDGNLFILDEKYQIFRFGSNELRCIIGCSNGVNFEGQRYRVPYAMSFDSNGNIFVLNTNKSRIQKFLLTRNICSKFN